MAPVAPRIGALRRLNAPSWVRPEVLNVTPDLLGMPLARPSRRAMAIALDGLVVLLLSSTGTFWIPAGIAALIYQLRRGHAQQGRRSIGLWLVLGLLVFVAGQHGLESIQRGNSPQAIAVAHDAETDSEESDARIAKLEAELAEARKPRPIRWRDEAVTAARSVGLGFGWAIAYFTLLPFWWKGQTLGKKVFRLRVVELTGKPLSLMNCFGRYGGYAAGMATGGIGFAQVLWDPNRQAIQDKLAHTVVVDLLQPRRDTSGASIALTSHE